MAPHPWVTNGPGSRQCDSCKATQRLIAGVWEPEFPRDCPNLDDDGDDRRGRKPSPPKPRSDGDDPIKHDIFEEAVYRAKEMARLQREHDPDGTNALLAAIRVLEQMLERGGLSAKQRLQAIKQLVQLEDMVRKRR